MKNTVFSKILFFLGTGSCLFFSACHSDHVDPEYQERTILVYMAADNSLSGDGENNINAILKGMEQTEGRLVIYIDPRYDVPRLLTIKGGKNCRVDTLETYAEEDSASPEVLARVVEEVQRRYPASSYGLVLWSHGLGWIPSAYSFPGAQSLRVPAADGPRTKYFAEDKHSGQNNGNTYMDIREMAQHLPGHFSFILWDACFMGSVEVAYQFRNKTDYIIASPAEVISDGFPYEKMIPLLWGGEEALKQVCGEYYNYYNQHPNGGDWRSAVVSLVKTEELERLAETTRTLLSGKTGYVQTWRYPLLQSVPDIFYDLGDYIRSMTSEAEYNTFKKQLDRVVIYKAATDKFFREPVPAGKFSGLNSYIPFSKWSTMNTYYYTLDWGNIVYSNN